VNNLVLEAQRNKILADADAQRAKIRQQEAEESVLAELHYDLAEKLEQLKDLVGQIQSLDPTFKSPLQVSAPAVDLSPYERSIDHASDQLTDLVPVMSLPQQQDFIAWDNARPA